MLHEFAARGSIARTAEALGYTPSAVSQQLAVLEREAGTPLLDRTARSAGLTAAGRRLAVHAERIGNNGTYRQPRVERAAGILKHHREPAAEEQPR